MTSRRRRRSERGYALISAIVLSVLYIGLISLLLIDSTRELNEAQRFRARVMAQTLAENGVELAADGLRTRYMATEKEDGWMGHTEGRMERDAGVMGTFTIEGKGTSAGVMKVDSTVKLTGTIDTSSGGFDIAINEVEHSR
jgi:type II secretory pathway component PulK